MDGNLNNGPEVMDWYQKELNSKRQDSSEKIHSSKVIDASDRFGQKVKVSNKIFISPLPSILFYII